MTQLERPAPQPTSKISCSHGQRHLWADLVPPFWKPYVQLSRLDLFAGSLLIFWPCTWGLSLVAMRSNMQLSNYIIQCVMFLLWSTLLHSVGSTWNDICDKDFDRLVDRTKNRPLAVGVVSVNAALLWMLPQVIVLAGLLKQFWNEALIFGMLELSVITLAYPFMKRITYWPQAWLGVAFSWGALIAWIANSPPEWPIIGLLMFTGSSWTIFYDTIYAMMDKKDDPQAGIKSTAVLFGDRARLILAMFALIFIAGLSSIGLLTHQRIPFFILSVFGSAIHLAWQVKTVVFEDARSCTTKFKSNGTQLGCIIWSGLLINYVLSLVNR